MLLQLQSQDILRWVPLKFPSLHTGGWRTGFCLWTIPTHQLSSWNSESDFFYLVLKPPLKYGPRGKNHAAIDTSPTPFCSVSNGCNELPFITSQSYMENKCCSFSRYPLVGRMLSALWRLICYFRSATSG